MKRESIEPQLVVSVRMPANTREMIKKVAENLKVRTGIHHTFTDVVMMGIQLVFKKEKVQ